MSLHLTKSNSVFFQVPKTGGTWAWKALENAGVKFTFYHEKGAHNNYILEDLTGKKSFAFVRQPIQFYKSYWCYRTESKKADTWHLEKYCWSKDFEEFLYNVIVKQYAYVTQFYKTYIGEPQVVDYVGRQENLVEDLISILKILNEDFNEKKLRDTPRENVSKTNPKYSKYLELGINLLEKDVINRYYYGSTGVIKK